MNLLVAAIILALVAQNTHGFSSVSLRRTNVPKSLGSRRFWQVQGNGSSIPADGDVWPVAIYWSYVEVGTPPISYPVAIDSGSGDLDIGAKGCKGCVTTPPNRGYDPKASNSSQPVFPYVFSNSYQTCDLKDPTAVCTITGSLYTEQVSLAGLGPVSVEMGAIESQTTNFDQFKVIDGVMGMTFPSPKNVFSQLVKAGLADNVWAMCMHEGPKSNGTLTIGGVDPRLSVGAVEYVPDAGEGFHSVQVNAMTLGSDRITSPVAGVAILDTGTNILLVPGPAMEALQKSMCSNSSLTDCNTLWNNTCVSLTQEQVSAYPPLTLNLDGLDLHMTSKDYLLLGSPLATSPDQYCLGIRNGGDAGGGFIIGDTTMRNYYLVFDLEKNRIGWGKVNTDNCGNI